LHFISGCEKLGKQMLKPPLGEYNIGALAGAVVGSIGGLFAIGVVPVRLVALWALCMSLR
jgi:hypothetical protein